MAKKPDPASKRAVLMAAIDAAQHTLRYPPTSEGADIGWVMLTAEHAKALADASKIAIAMIDRAGTAEAAEALT